MLVWFGGSGTRRVGSVVFGSILFPFIRVRDYTGWLLGYETHTGWLLVKRGVGFGSGTVRKLLVGWGAEAGGDCLELGLELVRAGD